jgi:perosamine synthetase
MPEMDEIISICKKHNLLILEDAAESIGSEYKGKKAGSFGDVSVFSFHGTKTMTTGEGGMMLTNDEKIYKRAKVINDHGRNPEHNKMFWMAELGHKYKMSNVQAALGLAQTERIEELIERKREIFKRYFDILSPLNIGAMNVEQSYVKNSYWMPTLIFHSELNVDREKLIAYFKTNNIDGRPFFYPLSSLPMFEKCEKNKVSYGIFERAINLPSFHTITDVEIKKVCDTILNFLDLKK